MKHDITSYSFTKKQAEGLAGCVVSTNEIRVLWLKKYHDKNGIDSLLSMMANFIGMTNSVIKNNREVIETALITDAKYHPHEAEKINLPTPFGALIGAMNAVGVDQEKTCEGCAFRKGTVASQCAPTQTDVIGCIEDQQPFMCHYNMDDDDKPTRKCRGFTQLKTGGKNG